MGVFLRKGNGMNFRLRGIVAMALSLGVCGYSLAAEGDRPPGEKPQGEKPAGDRPQGERRPGGEGRPRQEGGIGRGGMFGLGGGTGQVYFVLSELNMQPD